MAAFKAPGMLTASIICRYSSPVISSASSSPSVRHTPPGHGAPVSSWASPWISMQIRTFFIIGPSCLICFAPHGAGLCRICPSPTGAPWPPGTCRARRPGPVDTAPMRDRPTHHDTLVPAGGNLYTGNPARSYCHRPGPGRQDPGSQQRPDGYCHPEGPPPPAALAGIPPPISHSPPPG